MGLQSLFVQQRKFFLAALAFALVILGAYYLWSTRGAGQAAGIYLTGGGDGYVVIERSWIPGQLHVKEGVISFINDFGVVVAPAELKASFNDGQLTLRQIMRYQSDNGPWPLYSSDVDLSLVLAPSLDNQQDWELIEATQNVSTRESGPGLWNLIDDLSSSYSWDDFIDKLARYNGESFSASLKADHKPMPFFLHRIDDPRLEKYMKGRLYRPSSQDDLTMIRQLAVDHPGDPWLELHQVELEAVHGNLDAASGLLAQWQKAHGDMNDFLLHEAEDTAYKQVQKALLRRDYPSLPGIETLFASMTLPEKSLQEHLAWLNALAKIDRLIYHPDPLVIACYDPARPPYCTVPNFLTIQTIAKISRVVGVFDLLDGRRQDGLDLLSGSYRLGQSLCANGVDIERLIGIAVRAISVEGLRIHALNACETPEEIQDFRQRLAWLDQVPRQPTAESITFGFRGLNSQFDLMDYEYKPNYLEAETRARISDALWHILRMSAAARENLLTTGDFPQSGEGFAAMFENGLPLDPFMDEQAPIQFISTASECVVYSVGPDKIDGQAQISYDPTNGTLSSGDVLMHVPREREYPFPREAVHAADASELLRQFPNGLPQDPFADAKMRPLSILESDRNHPVRIFSFGPDGDQAFYMPAWQNDDVGEPVLYRNKLAQAVLADNLSLNRISQVGIPIDPIYDPTNGTTSDGDLFIDLPR